MQFLLLNSDAQRRDRLKALLPQIECQARLNEAQDWRQADRALHRQPPDLLTIDWQDWMSIAQVRRLLTRYAGLRIAVLTHDTSPGCVRNLLDKGVLGVVLRDTDPRLIARARDHAARRSPCPGRSAVTAASAAAGTRPSRTRGRQRQTATEAHPAGRQPVAAPGAAHALLAHGQHQRDDRPHAWRQRRHRQDPSVQHRPATRRPQPGCRRGALQRLAVCPTRSAAQADQDSPARPAMGQPGAVRLRRRKPAQCAHPLPASDTADTLPMAAKPVVPSGIPDPTNRVDARRQGCPASLIRVMLAVSSASWHGIRSHLFPSNE